MTARAERFLAVIERHRRWLLLALLAILHLVLIQDIAQPVARTLLVVHIGVFLLWQPIVRAQQRLSVAGLAVFAVAVTAAALLANTWLLVVWVMVLAAILGGRMFFSDAPAMRLFYLLALAYLIIALLVLLTPRIIPNPGEVPEAVHTLARVGLPLLLASMALVRLRGDRAERQEVIDFVYSALVFLLLAVLVLGTLALMLLAGQGYFESLAMALVALSLVLFLLGWAWNPRSGFSGFGLLFSRYVLSVGVPFEDWLRRVTELSRREPDPEAFVAESCGLFMHIPGVAGVDWDAGGKPGGLGGPGARCYELGHGALRLKLHAPTTLGQTLVWHFQLMVQVLGEFHLAKLRARQLQQLSYLEAVHETGARLTHDVKNLLQSLSALCFAVEREDVGDAEALQALVRRQLPAIAGRLRTTLDKLRHPPVHDEDEIAADAWWDEVRKRYAQGDIRFERIGAGAGATLPAALFTGTLENLVANAQEKRTTVDGLDVRVTLDLTAKPALIVCDTGPAFADEILRDLFRAPVPSRSGLGIGLYQLARQARSRGYRLSLCDNRAGSVCLRLEPGAAPANLR
jgi:hypothetical protein